MSTADVLTLNDCRRAGYCWKGGILPWLRDKGIDPHDFVEHGIPVEEARAMDDEFLNRAIALREQLHGE